MDLSKIRLRGARLIVEKRENIARSNVQSTGEYGRPIYLSDLRAAHGEVVCYKAKVVAVGPGVVDVKVGDTVLIDEFAGRPWYDLEVGRLTGYWLVGESEVMGVIEED